jgi:glycerol-3-phosphate acyltransferase PlsX
MRIIVDAMGGDNAPIESVKGCVMAANELDIEIVIVGKEEIVKEQLSNYKFPINKITVANADEIITNDDTPTKAIKQKVNSSMVIGLKMLKNNEGNAFVSAGNTGALLSGALFKIGRIKGIDRPALTPIIPTNKGCSLLIDAGANTVCKPLNLLQFGIMGSVYMKKVMNISSPRVGLINVGTEEGKGPDLVKSAFALLKDSPINFVGNVEAREIPNGSADVIVCDGFVGNIILKFLEGMGLAFYSNIKQIFTRNLLSYLGALMVKKGLIEFKKKMDYTEHGGAPLLGIDGVVIKAHGSSNAKSFYYSIAQAKKFVESEVIDEIREYLNINKEGSLSDG